MSYAEAQYVIDSVPSGIPPRNITAQVSEGDGEIYITFLPSDTVIDGQLFCTVGGVMIRYKAGSPPISMNDGTLVGNYISEEAYKHNSEATKIVVTGLTNDVEYYVQLFPYSDHGVYNLNKSNVFPVIPKGGADVSIWGFREDFTNVSPFSRITYIEDATGFSRMYKIYNSSTGPTDGSWAGWSWLQKIKPCMVGLNGQMDYELDPTDYSKKKDGSLSDVSNTSYAGAGAYTWIPKIYSKEVYSDDGNSRNVYFSLSNSTPATSDFKPIGFRDSDGNEIEGVWIPMFYTNNGKSIAGQIPRDDLTIFNMSTILTNSNPNQKFFGGPILNILRDIMFLLGRSTDVRNIFGAGFTTGSSYALREQPIITDGIDGFYGTEGSGSGQYNKAFHSVVMNSYMGYLCDPYMQEVKDTRSLTTSSFYKFYDPNKVESLTDLTNAGYINSGTILGDSVISSWIYPTKFQLTDDPDFGSIPVFENGGSTSTGLSDGVMKPSDGSMLSRVTNHFGQSAIGGVSGAACLYMSATNGEPRVCFAGMMLPPVGYKP